MTDKDIRRAIEETIAAGKHTLRISGDYDIFETVILPSDFTLILDDCCLRLADGVMVQIIRNEAAAPGKTMKKEDGDHDIKILGVGRAILDGGEYNGLSETTSEQNGMPHISQNNMLLFCGVTGFEVRGLQIRCQRWWALDFIHCDHGVVRDIDFRADDTRVLPDGTRVHGLIREDYNGVYIKNADGIDLRAGCHDILIENITGFCEDDIIALTDLKDDLDNLYPVEDDTHDIFNVAIRNVRGSSYCSMIRLLNQSGAKMYNILIDGVFDDSKDSPHMDRGLYAVRIGDPGLYGKEQPKQEEMDTITVRNVYARTISAVQLAGGMKNIMLDNINTFDGSLHIVEDERTEEEKAGQTPITGSIRFEDMI